MHMHTNARTHAHVHTHKYTHTQKSQSHTHIHTRVNTHTHKRKHETDEAFALRLSRQEQEQWQQERKKRWHSQAGSPTPQLPWQTVSRQRARRCPSISTEAHRAHHLPASSRPAMRELLATFKTTPCSRKERHDQRTCHGYHTVKDKRRNPFKHLYTPDECKNKVEVAYHPMVFRTQPCDHDTAKCPWALGGVCAKAHGEEQLLQRLTETVYTTSCASSARVSTATLADCVISGPSHAALRMMPQQRLTPKTAKPKGWLAGGPAFSEKRVTLTEMQAHFMRVHAPLERKLLEITEMYTLARPTIPNDKSSFMLKGLADNVDQCEAIMVTIFEDFNKQLVTVKRAFPARAVREFFPSKLQDLQKSDVEVARLWVNYNEACAVRRMWGRDEGEEGEREGIEGAGALNGDGEGEGDGDDEERVELMVCITSLARESKVANRIFGSITTLSDYRGYSKFHECPCCYAQINEDQGVFCPRGHGLCVKSCFPSFFQAQAPNLKSQNGSILCCVPECKQPITEKEIASKVDVDMMKRVTSARLDARVAGLEQKYNARLQQKVQQVTKCPYDSKHSFSALSHLKILLTIIYCHHKILQLKSRLTNKTLIQP